MTIALASILVSLATPSFLSIIEKNRIASVTNELVGALTYARDEAITRNQSVVVCRVADPNASAPSCVSGETSGWETGWIVFIDVDGNRSFGAGDFLLRVYPAAPPNYVITASQALGWVAFNANGNAFFDNGALGTTFTVTPNSESDVEARSLVVSSTGRIRLEDKES